MRIRYRGSRQRSSRRLIRASERQDSGRQRQRVPHEAQKRQEKKAGTTGSTKQRRASERAGEAEAEAKGQRQCDHKKQVSKAKALQSHKLAQQRRQ